MDDNSNSSSSPCSYDNENENDMKNANENECCSLLIPEYDAWDDELYNGTIDRVLLHDIKYNNNSVSTIDLCYNRIGQDGVVLLAHALQSNTIVTELNLSGCFIYDIGLDTLLNGIVQRQNHPTSNLHILKLNNNGITHVGATKIATALLLQPQAPSITVLHLNSNELRDKGARILASSLRQNTTLGELSLCHNKIGNDGAIAFGQELLQKSSELRQLNLSDNFISTVGFQNILTALQRNTKLKELYMEHNTDFGGITGQDLYEMIAGVLKASSVTNMEIHSLIFLLLKFNTSLTHLYLNGHNNSSNDNNSDNNCETLLCKAMEDWNDTMQFMTWGNGCCYVDDSTTATRNSQLGRLLSENRMGLRRAPKKMERQRLICFHDLQTYWIPSP